MSKEAFHRAVEHVHGQTEMARRLGVKQGHVWAWLNRNKGPFPAEYCAAVEQATDGAITKQDLRPDLFGAPAKQHRRAANQ